MRQQKTVPTVEDGCPRRFDMIDSSVLADFFHPCPIARHDQPHRATMTIGRIEQRTIERADATRGGVVGVGNVKRFYGHRKIIDN